MTDDPTTNEPHERDAGEGAARTTLTELAWLFLRLGSTAFGGPAAHIAMMRDEVVTRRGWLTDQRFLDLLGATNLVPGPSSTEMAIHVGFERRRFAGLLVAGISFILPAALIATACGWAYVRFGAAPSARGLLYGVKPVILGVVAQAIWGLLPSATKTTGLRFVGLGAGALAVFGASEVVVLLGAGAVAVTMRRAAGPRAGARPEGVIAPLLPAAGAAAAGTVAAGVGLPSLFWVFLKIGSLLFGSGYVLLAFLRTELVERLGWLTEAQLIDAVAIGQVTPGPLFSTATFIGFLISGPSGAAVATAGIFLPAFVFVAVSGPLVPRLRRSPTAGAFLDGVNVAALALMAVVTGQLARAALVDAPTAVLGASSLCLLLVARVSPTWLILVGGAVGLAVHAGGLAGG